MIRDLQKKFIRSAMLAVTLLTAVFLASVNIINYMSVSRDMDRIMERILLENGRGVPDEKPEEAPEALPEDLAGDSQAERPEMRPEERPELKPEMQPDEKTGRKPDENDLARERFFCVRVAEDGRIIYTDLDHISSLDSDEAEALVDAAAAKGTSSGHVEGFIFRRENDSVSGGAVYTFLDEKNQKDSLLRTLIITLLVGAFTWLLMLLLIIFLSRKAIRPIAENIERQKRFVTDAGHEIKTPLAIITANADALELHTGQNKWINNIRSQTARLTELTQNMLTLARMDEGVDTKAARTFDASKILTEILASFEENMNARDVRLIREIEAGVMLHFPEDAYRRLLSVLTENAVKYVDEGGEIRVKLAPAAKGAQLTFENTCEKLPDCEPARLFDRFYRADEARSRSTGGSGIGLAVARAVAGTGGGRIDAEYAGENRIRFRAWLQNVKA